MPLLCHFHLHKDYLESYFSYTTKLWSQIYNILQLHQDILEKEENYEETYFFLVPLSDGFKVYQYGIFYRQERNTLARVHLLTLSTVAPQGPTMELSKHKGMDGPCSTHLSIVKWGWSTWGLRHCTATLDHLWERCTPPDPAALVACKLTHSQKTSLNSALSSCFFPHHSPARWRTEEGIACAPDPLSMPCGWHLSVSKLPLELSLGSCIIQGACRPQRGHGFPWGGCHCSLAELAGFQHPSCTLFHVNCCPSCCIMPLLVALLVTTTP